MNVKITDIGVSGVALRGVNTENADYIEVRDSIRSDGLLNPIAVKANPLYGTEGQPPYIVVDGLHRLTAFAELGKDEIPVHVVEVEDNDAELLIKQMLGNAQRVDTKPCEYAAAITAVMLANPGLTMSDLSARMSKSPQWLEKILKLVKIKDEDLKNLINSGKITLQNAVALSKLPEEEQKDWAKDAMTKSGAEFTSEVDEHIRTARKNRVTGAPAEFKAVPHYRSMKDILPLLNDAVAAKEILGNEKNAAKAFLCGLAYAVSMDPESVAAQKAEYDARQAEKAAKVEAKKAERIKKMEAEVEALRAADAKSE